MKKLLVLMIIMHIGLCYAQKPADWKEPKEIRDILTAAGDEAGLPRGLAHCVAYAESRFIPTARSKVVNGYRSCGLMQLYRMYIVSNVRRFSSHPYTFLWDNPADNAEVGCKYLAFLIERFDGSVYLGILAYNYGETNLRNITSMDDVPKRCIKYADSILKNLDAWDESW